MTYRPQCRCNGGVRVAVASRPESEVKAEALREAADAQDADPEFRDPLRLKSEWLRVRADQIEAAR